MAVSVDEYNRLKKQVADANTVRDRALGQRDGLIVQLKTEFECGTLAEAEAMSAKLDAATVATETKYNTARDEFDAEWAESIAEQTGN